VRRAPSDFPTAFIHVLGGEIQDRLTIVHRRNRHKGDESGIAVRGGTAWTEASQEAQAAINAHRFL